MRIEPTQTGYLLTIEEKVPIGQPHKSNKGKGKNDVYQGGCWISTKTNGSKKEHLYRLNIMLTDCGEKKQQ